MPNPFNCVTKKQQKVQLSNCFGCVDRKRLPARIEHILDIDTSIERRNTDFALPGIGIDSRIG